MLVKDLITALSLMPPEKEVFMDVTTEVSNVFIHKIVDDVADVETETGDYVLLLTETEWYGNSLN